MRNFEERMDEIQKRSHARIIRRRRQLSMLCMPLVAAVCVCGALMIRQPGVYSQTDSTQPNIPIMQAYSDSIPALNEEFIPTYTDKEKVAIIQDLIAELVLVEEFTIDMTRADTIHTQAMSANETFTFILESEDSTTEYILIGNTLADRNAEAVYKLTDLQHVALLELLELPVE